MIMLMKKKRVVKVFLGFVNNEDDKLTVNVSNDEVDRLIKEYKR